MHISIPKHIKNLTESVSEELRGTVVSKTISNNNNNEVQVINNNGELVVSSRQVAENFGKEHNKVIRTIEEIRGVAKIGDTREMFHKTTYEHPQNHQMYTEYLMNRDGFSLLMMSFRDVLSYSSLV